MKKRKNILLVAFTLFFISIYSQNNLGKSNDFERIALNTYISDQVEELPTIAEGLLENKISRIASENGVGGSSYNPRFILTPNITVMSKNFTSTAPPMVALVLEVSLYIGDGITGVKFANTSIQVKGVGTNENKAFLSALKQIKPTNKKIKDFLVVGKSRIIKYYNNNCDFILKHAQMLESQNKFEEAIAVLTAVPEVCKECYMKSMDAVTPIYQKYIDRECQLYLTKAKNAWSSGQDFNSATNASFYLGKINPLSNCYPEVEKLTNQIRKRIKEIDKREWNFILKKQQDNVNLEQSRIKAVRDVGVAYGNNQPKETYNIRSWW